MKSDLYERPFSSSLSEFAQTLRTFQAYIRTWRETRVLAAALRASNLQVCSYTTLFPRPPCSPLPATSALVQLGADSGLERGSVRHPRNVLADDNVERLVALGQQVH